MPAVSRAQRIAMAPTDAAYIAGFLDGEGYITIRRANRYLAGKRPRRNPSYCLVVGFTNTDLEILKWIKEYVGSGCINPKARRSHLHSPAFELTIHQASAIEYLLRYAGSYIKIKKRQVEVALAFLELKPSKRIVVGRLPAKGNSGSAPLLSVAPEDLEAREALKLKMTDLNARGPQHACAV